MFGDSLKKKLLNEIDISDNEQVRALCGALAARERNRRVRQAEHFDALDIDVQAPELKSHDERVDELIALVEARVTGTPWEFWTEYQAPPGLENTDRARDYAGMDADEWEHRVGKWADVFREQLDDAGELSERELAGLYVERRFGVDLATFEDVVVAWDESAVLEEALLGPGQAMDAALQEATVEVRNGTE